MPVDDSVIDDISSQLNDYQNNLLREIEKSQVIMRGLAKVRSIVTGYDVSNNGDRKAILSPPLDHDMGNTVMDNAKRQIIYDTNLALAKKILGIK